MSERIIDLGERKIDPADFYGAADVNFHRLVEKFPELKIVARGAMVKLSGTDRQIAHFEERFGQLAAYYRKYGHISPEVVDQIFDVPASLQTEAVSEAAEAVEDVIVFGNNGMIVRARTENQRRLVKLYGKNDLLFAVGPAGSGKTYTAIALAVRALKNREVRRIILTRPAVEAGEKLGFLPGDLKEKLDPYLQPLYDALNDMIPPKKLQDYMAEGIVQIAPLAYMRGRTLDNAFVILDEAQNTNLSQIKMFLTRMGRNARFIVTGDATQIDLPNRQDSGLLPAIERLRGIRGIGVVEFDRRDIVRHELVKQIVQAFDGI
ncbi:MAG: PhoH family protein [Rikenella sp.]|nr:PhoH family protein [Rikenella sp.]